MSSASKASSPFARPLLTLFNAGTAVGLSDDELLQRFTSGGDDTAEMAFSVLVERHGAMVLRVCRSVTGDRSEAEDAFQSTFLILARKARSVRVGETLAPWLYGVARKVSARATASTQRRRRFIERFAEWSRGRGTTPSPPSDDSATTLIREELARLPHRYQAAVRLCDLDGFTQEEAALLLKLPLGTIKSRLFRGRSKLREALIRKGFTTNWLCLVTPGVSPAIPPNLAALAIRAALYESQGKLAAGALISSTVIALTEGSMQAMFMTKVKVAVCLALGAGVVAGGTLSRTGTGAVFGAFQQGPETAKAEAAATAKDQAAVSAAAQRVSQAEITKILQKTVNAFLENRRQAKKEAERVIQSAEESLKDKFLAENSGGIFQKQLEERTKERDSLDAQIRELEGVIRLGDLASPSVGLDQVRQAMNPNGTPKPSAPTTQVLPPTNAGPTNGLPDSGGNVTPPPPTESDVPPLKPLSTIEHEIALAQKKLEAKQAALKRAKAQESLADSVVAINERLEKRIPGSVSYEDGIKAKAEVNVAQGGVEVAEAEFQASQLELDWLKRLAAGNPQSSPSVPVTPDNVLKAQAQGVLDDLTYQSAISRANLLAKKAAVRRAQAEAQQAKSVLTTREKLKANNVISAEDLRKAQSELEITMGKVEVAEAELQTTQIEHDWLKTKAEGDTSSKTPDRSEELEKKARLRLAEIRDGINFQQSRLIETKGALRRARTEAEEAKGRLARLVVSNPNQASGNEEIQNAKAEVEKAMVRVDTAEAGLQGVQLEFDRLQAIYLKAYHGTPEASPPLPVTSNNVLEEQSSVFIDERKHQLAINQSHLVAKKGALRQAEARLSQAQSILATYEKLKANQAISVEDLQKAKTEVEVAQGGVDIAQAELQESQLEVDRVEALLRKTIEGKPKTSPTSPSSPDQGEFQGKMEKRIADLESKLDQALELLKLVAPPSSPAK